MSALLQDVFSERMPTAIETESAGQLLSIMSGLIKDDEPARLKLALGQNKPAEVVLSPAIASTFVEILRLISSGKGFRLLPVDAELTTQEAADLLNVSRPFLIKLLESGKIPFTKTGRHRRIKAENLFTYKAKRDGDRDDALSDMARYDAENAFL
ncbi:helix-turn-helix domain-containing protein [Pelagibius sp. Alg239-R121]|uniref:helix-turn-helix domain-containing protein n=1 Tax=Pelagibius sp. Alg239-R121 TaxID=2993448 RepID=UPI0024A7722E|nr:helix-turn-helix domain-containing protein [Pelagibius sp. Alg239-R121]